MKQFFLCLLVMICLPCVAFAGKVQEIKTPGGLTIWLMEEHALPIITTQVSFTGSGTAYDPREKDGRTNMVAALLLEGAGARDAKTFNEALEEEAIRLNVGVDEDLVQAMLQTITTHKEQAFSMLADALIRPRFDADAVIRVRAKMQALLVEQRESPSYKLMRGWQEAVYGNHPYARVGLGTEQSLNALSEKDFRDYVKRYLTKENMIISVVGDISPAEITALLDKQFAGLPARYAPDSEVPDIAFPAQASEAVIVHEMPQSIVNFGLPGLKRSDPDYIPAFVMNQILGGSGLGSRLADAIRVKRALTYGIHTQMEPKAHSAAWRGVFSTRNGEVKNAVELLKSTLATFVSKGVTKEELADAKSYLTGSFILGLSSNEDVASFLNMMQVHKLGSDYLEKRNSLIEQVSAADIKRVSERLIDPARLRMVIVGKP